MHLSTLKLIKTEVIELLSTLGSLYTEEIQGAFLRTPGASVELALESLEKEGMITTNTSSQFILTEKALKKIK